MTFGAETDEAGSHAQLDRFVEAGGTLVDTADVYSGGVSEEIIGRWFADRPADVTERVVLATKGRFPMGDEPNALGLSTRHLTRALDASLERLDVDVVDLYQVHAFDPFTPLEETLRTLDGFIRAGKINYYGLSNFTGWQLTKAVHLAAALGVAAPVSLQPQYSLLVREIEWEIVPAVLDAGMGMLPWSPLGGGWLSGKYQRDQRPTGDTRLGDNPERGMEAYDRRGTERTWQVIDAVQEIAEARGVSMAEVALAWVTDRPGVTSTILGCRTMEQLETNLRAADLTLTDDRDGCSGPGQRSARERLPLRRAGRRSTQPETVRPLTERSPDDLVPHPAERGGVDGRVRRRDPGGLSGSHYAIPVAALALNIAWESIYAVRSLRDGPDVQGAVNLVWFVADAIIVWTFLRYGRPESPSWITRKLFASWALLMLIMGFAVQLLFIAEFGWSDAPVYAAFLQNLLMSVLFIAMLVARGGTRGQTLTIAVAKWIGTLAPTLTFGVIYDSAFILGVGMRLQRLRSGLHRPRLDDLEAAAGRDARFRVPFGACGFKGASRPRRSHCSSTDSTTSPAKSCSLRGHVSRRVTADPGAGRQFGPGFPIATRRQRVAG